MAWRCWRRGSNLRRVSRVCAWFVGRVLWSVQVSWRGGPSAQKTRVLGGRNAPLYRTGNTQCCSCGLNDRQCHFPGDCISQARNEERQGWLYNKRRSNRLGKQPVDLLGVCVLNQCQVPMMCQWHRANIVGQVAVSAAFLSSQSQSQVARRAVLLLPSWRLAAATYGI
jgi:hypothetical protein